MQQLPLAVHVANLQPDRLSQTQTAGIDESQHGAVAQQRHVTEDLGDFLDGQDDRQRVVQRRPKDPGERPRALERALPEELDGAERDGERLARPPALVHRPEHVGANLLLATAYTFTASPKGQPAVAIPDGYEVYENVEGQVFLRKKFAVLVSDAELAVIQNALRAHGPAWQYWVEVGKNTVTIHEAGGDMDSLSDMCREFQGRGLTDDERRRHASYMAVLRFTLVDPESREYVTERYCFRGSVDDWIHIAGPDLLAPQCREFIPHLGRESFYDLF